MNFNDHQNKVETLEIHYITHVFILPTFASDEAVFYFLTVSK